MELVSHLKPFLDPSAISNAQQARNSVRLLIDRSINLEKTAADVSSVRLLGRREQVDKIVEKLGRIDLEKLTPIVISSSRGMGKTFLLQKLAFGQLEGSGLDEKILPLENALRCGRVCAHWLSKPFSPYSQSDAASLDSMSERYASAILVQHILELFGGSTVADIRFDSVAPFNVLLDRNWDDFAKNLGLQALIRSMLSTATKVFSEWLRLTQVAFGLSDSESASIRPVILIDEMQYLSAETGHPSSSGVSYTFLAEVLCNTPV